ncbi:MAG: hypothetical protein QXG00_06255 [Candidatus Woesearchaeota archaeon]
MVVILWNKKNCKSKKNSKEFAFINAKDSYRISDLLAEMNEKTDSIKKKELS